MLWMSFLGCKLFMEYVQLEVSAKFEIFLIRTIDNVLSSYSLSDLIRALLRIIEKPAAKPPKKASAENRSSVLFIVSGFHRRRINR